MDIYGYLWISMDIYGYLWISIGIYGYLWISIYLQSQGLPVNAFPVTCLVVFVINHDTQTPT